MILPKIKRGAMRACSLIDGRIHSYQKRLPISRILNTSRSAVLSLLAVRIIVLPIPIAAPSTDPVAAASSNDADPLPYARQIVNSSTLHSLTFNAESPTLLSLSPIALIQPEKGKSLTMERDEAEQQRLQAIEEQKQQEQLRLQQEEAKRQLELRRQEEARRLAAQRAAAAIPVGSVQEIIVNAAQKYGVSSTMMLNIAYCESHYNPAAKNRYSAASGLYQFMPSTFAGTPPGRAGQSIWSAEANAEAAAWKISQGGIGAWSASRACWSRR